MSKTTDKKVENCVRDKSGRIVLWEAGYSKKEIKVLLKAHPGWYRSVYVIGSVA